MFRILVVEDNKNLRTLIAARLKQAGYQAFQAVDGEKALAILDSEQIDLMITDIMMPVINGYQLTEMLRQAHYDLPVLMVTAKESFADKEKGFRVGTDDYMVKPINMNELILRVEAILRRAKIANDHKLQIGNVVLDYDTLTVTAPDMTYELPKKEFYLLFKLLSYPKKIFTRQQLMDEIWGMDSEANDRTVDSHIKKLRKKFESRPEFQIITIRGLGYKAERML
ncbi:response regulator transcription factor [Desulfitobacterium chlororespirans]|uniref:Heme response regulator HssR n=1 Tax=Desulfitobacterium chlororespirans DSM 11544 TaxID=1121395 RepID=A0A1M7TGP2_9FIRM|nr:response regulator transcription factor [Desulfitobacterium chlororespirans]SHN69778.1 DNA-binding response regulator, OmpR family, contains REC and winged-helix (wHTH) domain [Desulfitobacterium chlororespirans DSM 11544]